MKDPRRTRASPAARVLFKAWGSWIGAGRQVRSPTRELTSRRGGYEVLVTASAFGAPPTRAMLAL